MNQYGLRYLYKYLGKVIKKLPFIITNHNREVAVVLPAKDKIFVQKGDEIMVQVYPMPTETKNEQ